MDADYVCNIWRKLDLKLFVFIFMPETIDPPLDTIALGHILEIGSERNKMMSRHIRAGDGKAGLPLGHVIAMFQ
jgi:hypothetical protein